MEGVLCIWTGDGIKYHMVLVAREREQEPKRDPPLAFAGAAQPLHNPLHPSIPPSLVQPIDASHRRG